jgi:transcription elongation GreA/GreB family factor
MITMIGSRTPLAALLRHKLGSAVIMLPSDISPDLVTGGRSVRFRINNRDRDERELVWHGGSEADPYLLPLHEPRGLALLGLSVGHTIAYGIGNNQTEQLTVEHVLANEDLSLPPITREAAALFARS